MISNDFFQSFVDLEAGVGTDDEQCFEDEDEDFLEGVQKIFALLGCILLTCRHHVI